MPEQELFTAKGLGGHITVTNFGLKVGLGITGRKEADLAWGDINGFYMRPARVLTNGQFFVGTKSGKLITVFTRNHSEVFETLAAKLRDLGISEEQSVKKMSLYSNSQSAKPADKRAKSPSSHQRQFVLDEVVFAGVLEVMDHRGEHASVMPRDEDYTELEVVGESFYQEALALLARSGAGDEAGWQYGFLAPEPDNEYDANAVAVYAIVREPGKPLDAAKVGHLPRELAAELSGILQQELLDTGRIVPLLLRLTGGLADKKTYGVIARAYSELVAE